MRHEIFCSTFLVVLATACGGATTGGSGNDGGGASGSGGGGGTPNPGPVTCTAGSVTFEFTSAGAPAVTYCVGKNCGVEWLAVKDASGQEMALTHSCSSDCALCQQMGCDLLCALPRVMTPEGERQVWDGTFFTQGMCGQGNTCAIANCAPPGKYVATMCAGVKNNTDPMFCMTDPDQQCVDVEFDYPTTSVVRGTVGPIK